MLKRIIAGHIGLNHLLVKMIATNQCEGYNLPQGVLTQLYREIAAHRPGLITKIGIGTFVDPRLDGGKLNERTKNCEDLIEVIQIGGEEALLYKTFPADAGIIRGTAADPQGNITCENEALTMENLEVAMAVKNSRGIVIAQVERLLDAPANPQLVRIPGVLVDYVVVAPSRKTHPQTLFVEHDPSYTGAARVSLEDDLVPLPLNAEKVICRRAAFELRPGMVVNLGIGIPMSIASVACEEKLLDSLVLTTELGIIGGLPQGGKNFGPAKNPSAFISQAQMFDFYDGGGLDLTCVGLAQVDPHGNVNVSRFGPRIIGAGGFIDITQSARRCLFCGEFTAAGSDVGVENGKIVIRQEGKAKKFVHAVQQITFSGQFAADNAREVLYITERCVFRLAPEGLVLAEVAPGIDIERDIVGQMEFRPIIPDEVPLMNPLIFQEEPMRVNGHSLRSV